MIESLEGRALLSSAVLDGDTLKVLGTNESETIRISDYVITDPANRKQLIVSYVVFANDQRLGGFEQGGIRQINVFSLGGNDRIVGPNARASGMVDPRSGIVLDHYEPANLYVEGGSGKDRIYGGLSNDTLKGGRGNDVIGDGFGRNYVDGGAGDDLINVNDGQAGGLGGPGSPAPRGSDDTIVSNAGNDEVHRDELDRLQYSPLRTLLPFEDDSSGVIVQGGLASVVD